MAYNAISQADRDVASDDSRSPSPHDPKLHHKAFQPLTLDLDHHVGEDSHLEPAKTTETSSISLGSMIRSMTATSYDMVDEDDYEQPREEEVAADRRSRPRPSINTSFRRDAASVSDASAQLASAEVPEPPLRTPITDHPIPLSHPMPDLQSLQGAYLGNVERLERSAEQMSASSADIESEIRRLDLEQKRRSCSSFSNSMITSNHSGFSPTDNMSPPQVSSSQPVTRLRSGSGSRLALVSEHEPDVGGYGHAVDLDPNTQQIPPLATAQDHYNPMHYDGHYDPGVHSGGDRIERPSSAASGDTFQQARVLFTDFDGVHYVPREKAMDPSRQISLTMPPMASGSKSHEEPQEGEDMVYYPAPVPRMLNLPPRLSQKPTDNRDKRRTQLLTSLSHENAKSTLPSGPDDDAANEKERSKRLTDIPPQLRASVFFEQPAAPINVEVKQASAVATLDSILDASTHAPVSAFTDHPFAGHLGAEVYGRPKHKKTSSNDMSLPKKKYGSRSTLALDYSSGVDAQASRDHLPTQTEAEAADVYEGSALREGEHDEEDSESEEESEYEEEDLSNYMGPPNTLLAELESRKQELQQRRRTAATTVGLHSTLLQLDAVAQKQSEHRRQRPVTLAWEAPDTHRNEDVDDDDVPLGMLFPEKSVAVDTRPLGLMEKKQLEESEPLSRRRARLRGEAPPAQPPSFANRPATVHTQLDATRAPADGGGGGDGDSGDEGETLAQRLKRLRGQDRNSTAVESEFATEILSEFRNMHDAEEKDAEGETGHENETLGERRARLQREKKEKLLPNRYSRVPAARRSIADMSQLLSATAGRRQSMLGTGIHPEAAESRVSMYQYPSNLGHAAPVGYPQYPEYSMHNAYGQGMTGAHHPNTNTFYSDAILGANHMSYASPAGLYSKMANPAVVEPGQRDVIDRWRQSIR